MVRIEYTQIPNLLFGEKMLHFLVVPPLPLPANLSIEKENMVYRSSRQLE
jgi:hypothetical protein